MDIEHKDFIGFYKNVYPEGFCKHLIDEFESIEKKGAGFNRRQSEGSLNHKKADTHIFSMTSFHLTHFENRNPSSIFFEGLQKCYEEYCNEYSILADIFVRTNHMKAQKTKPGQGYHVWHCEKMTMSTQDRVLVYILYLNTIQPEDAGETEFLYQKLRVCPEENTLIIWPASFTHTHRGNVLHGQTNKYIITGWFNHAE